MWVYIYKHKWARYRYNYCLLIYISNIIYFQRGFHRIYRCSVEMWNICYYYSNFSSTVSINLVINFRVTIFFVFNSVYGLLLQYNKSGFNSIYGMCYFRVTMFGITNHDCFPYFLWQKSHLVFFLLKWHCNYM